MPIDDRTVNINLPLPNQDNFLLEDVVRLRSALTAIDVAIKALDTTLTGKSPTIHGHLVSEVSGLAATLAALASSSTVITAAGGLTGGGSLAVDRSIALGIPGTLSTSSANQVAEDSHTHEVTFPVTSVNGKTGAAILATSDISESGNLYFTNTRAANAAPVQSVAGKSGSVSLTKSDVGLASVDNTSDANKPLSTATQNALNAKVNSSSPTFTGVATVQNNALTSENILESATDGNGGGLQRVRATRGTIPNKVAVLDGDLLGAIQFEAWDGASYKVAALIRSFMSGAAGLNDVPASISIETTNDGQATPTQHILITHNGRIQIKGALDSNIVSLGTGNTIDCSAGTYFTRSVSGVNFVPVFANVPLSVSYGITLKIAYVSGTITWPASILWPNGVAPTLTTANKTHLVMLATDNGGVTWRGAALVNYTG